MTLKELAVKHPYYSSDSNYFSNDASASFDTWQDFIDEWGDVDRDYNLCFRFDVTEREEDGGGFGAQISLLQQRKGIYYPITIEEVEEKDVESMVNWLSPYWDLIQKLWTPFSNKP